MSGPIDRIHIWGSWHHNLMPYDDPTAVTFTMSIHEDLPVGHPQNPNPWSIPGQVLWVKTFYSGEFDAQQYMELPEGWFVPCAEPPYYDPLADNICWLYMFPINPSEVFWQEEGKIYWLDVQAEPMHWPSCPEPVRFGWKNTTEWYHFNDDAVWAVGIEQNHGPWNEMHYPQGHPLAGMTTDLAFEIFTGMTKWTQPPDTNPETSIDIDATKDQVWQPQVLADDFQCTSADPITDIHLWGSWYHNMVPYNDPNKVIFKLSIRADIPADQSPTGYSMPGEVLWEREFQPDEFKASIFADGPPEGYLVPCSEPPYYEPVGDTICYQYDFVIDPREAFVQQGSTTNPVIYWLSVQARQVRPAAGEPIYPMRSRFGWKTRDILDGHFMDDAVWSKDNGVTWNELRYPDGHPYMGMSADLAFEIVTQKQSEQFNLIRQVADDWRCESKTPVTAAVWWGSYIDYRYEPYQGVQQGQPTKPDYFLLSIWNDVPAATVAAGSSTGDVNVYDTAGNLLWSYNTGANVASVDVSSDGAYIAVGSQGNKLYLFARDGTKLWEKSVPIAYGGLGVGEESKSVAISAYGEYVVAGCTDKLYVYKKNGTLHYSNAGQETCVEISPNGNYIASCNKADGTIHLFSNTATGCTLLWTKTINGAFWIATSDPGYVAVNNQTTVYLYNSAGTQIWSYSHAKWDGDIIRVDMPQDGLSVVAANDDPANTKGCVLCYWNNLKDGTSGWSATDSTPVWTYDPGGAGSDYYSVAISGNGSYIATGGTQGPCLFASTSNVPLQTFGMGTTHQSLDLTDTGFGACGNSLGNLYYFSKNSNIPLWNKALGGNVHAVAVSRGSDQFSHPGSKIWEYKTESYDEVLVGYDKHPEPGEQGGGFEPVFRYSVKLPKENWFLQTDVNNIYWFSAVAVYDQSEPNYWGWTNHKHVFNDDAVAGYQSPTGEWIWEELYDQTGESEDMSFILFNEPECLIGGNAGVKEYSDWVAWGRPKCWCYPRQCRGDVNGKKLGVWVQSADLTCFKLAYGKTDAVLATVTCAGGIPGVCADLNHSKLGVRVQTVDLTLFKTYYGKLDNQVPLCDQLPIYTGPYNFWTSP